jgi:hypothetical protein
MISQKTVWLVFSLFAYFSVAIADNVNLSETMKKL